MKAVSNTASHRGCALTSVGKRIAAAIGDAERPASDLTPPHPGVHIEQDGPRQPDDSPRAKFDEIDAKVADSFEVVIAEYAAAMAVLDKSVKEISEKINEATTSPALTQENIDDFKVQLEAMETNGRAQTRANLLLYIRRLSDMVIEADKKKHRLRQPTEVPRVSVGASAAPTAESEPDTPTFGRWRVW
eukprot:TRINITY_DN39371_c0_g1_i1.p1 TRINITY_DN39371_c0_g1~~TRINITY_DN39371_c0_g1_i1.p1  ORF type:complete len:189 (+),score=36.05 TRINITY_DN39371_c0_g1_i1:189-755(+)